MPSLKEYRDKIASVKSTKKITSAMKMVAASKLKKAQEQAEAGQPYAASMVEMLERVSSRVTISDSSPRLLIGTGNDDVHLFVVVTSDRGLCGGFNGNLLRKVRKDIAFMNSKGKKVKIVCVGRKSWDGLRGEYASIVVERMSISAGKGLEFSDANKVSNYILEQFDECKFDICTLYYNEFKSVIAQIPTSQQLIPFKLPEVDNSENIGIDTVYDFEPEEEKILSELLPRNLSVQLFRSMLDSGAGEQAARMTAMDNATRNAGDMVNNLSLQYNRARQAHITKELIEIISGAEAV